MVKTDWLEEQQVIRRQEIQDLQAGLESRRLVSGPLGSVTFDLSGSELSTAALEALRLGDDIALRHLFRGVVDRAADAIRRGEVETELADTLDKLTCLGATFLEYERVEWFDLVVKTLSRIYSQGVKDEDEARRYAINTSFGPDDIAPRVWLQVIQRVFGLGGMAVSLESWPAVRSLTLQVPEHLDRNYETSWLRHALTMASRAQHLGEQHASLLTLARSDVART
jgi:hypothetical protein